MVPAMCNQYEIDMDWAEIAAIFGVSKPPPATNASSIVVPGHAGPVVHQQQDGRILRSMVWGFPLPQVSKRTGEPIKPKPVNNVANLDSPMWRSVKSKPAQRCLIPLTRFAEAEGTTGAKTRTWFRVADHPVIAWAGFWRDSGEWGPVYSGLMRDAIPAIQPVHDRMPVLLWPDEWARWLGGTVEDVLALRERPIADEHIIMERTAEPWLGRRQA